MGSTNRGKQFENIMREQLGKLKNVAVIRLYDTTNGFVGVNNPCDLVVYTKPKLMLFECKAISGHLLNFNSHIRENQWEKLLEYSKIDGVEAGILVWFYEKHKTYYIDIQTLDMLRQKGKKSFDCEEDVPTCIVYGQKKRVFYDYYLERFMKELLNE